MRTLDDIRGTSGLRTTSGPSCGTVVGLGSAMKRRKCSATANVQAQVNRKRIKPKQTVRQDLDNV
jgi:hypothetical protein